MSFDNLPIPIYLALKEIWRNKMRYLLVSSVVALLTMLVLFIAGLTEGLGTGNRELLEKLPAELVVYQENIDLSIPSSKIPTSVLRRIKRVAGVKETGALVFSRVAIVLE